MKASDVDSAAGVSLQVFQVFEQQPNGRWLLTDEHVPAILRDDHETDFVNIVQVTSPSEPVSADGGVGQ